MSIRRWRRQRRRTTVTIRRPRAPTPSRLQSTIVATTPPMASRPAQHHLRHAIPIDLRSRRHRQPCHSQRSGRQQRRSRPILDLQVIRPQRFRFESDSGSSRPATSFSARGREPCTFVESAIEPLQPFRSRFFCWPHHRRAPRAIIRPTLRSISIPLRQRSRIILSTPETTSHFRPARRRARRGCPRRRRCMASTRPQAAGS